MRAIWKFPILEINDEVELFMPKYAQILCVQVQNDTPCLWAQIDSEQPLQLRTLAIYGTGHPIERDSGVYIGTFQFGSLVFHVFDKGEQNG